MILRLLVLGPAFTRARLAGDVDAGAAQLLGLLGQQYQVLAAVPVDRRLRVPDGLAFAAEAAHGQPEVDAGDLRAADLHDRVNQMLDVVDAYRQSVIWHVVALLVGFFERHRGFAHELRVEWVLLLDGGLTMKRVDLYLDALRLLPHMLEPARGGRGLHDIQTHLALNAFEILKLLIGKDAG